MVMEMRRRYWRMLGSLVMCRSLDCGRGKIKRDDLRAVTE